MSPHAQMTFEARKTPVQSRSAVTVEAIGEATIQVLLAVGADRLTTTRVAERAGVSVGTLYQYFPNKRALLFAAMEQHLSRLNDAVEKACGENHQQPVEVMVDAVVKAFIDAKLARPDVSLALYTLSSEFNGVAIVKRLMKSGRLAIEAMLKTATNARFEEVEFTTFMLFAAMAGSARALLEGGPTPKMVRSLRRELPLLCGAYLVAASIKEEASGN